MFYDLNYYSFGEFGLHSDRDVSLAIVEHKVYIPFGGQQNADWTSVSLLKKPVITNNILAGNYISSVTNSECCGKN